MFRSLDRYRVRNGLQTVRRAQQYIHCRTIHILSSTVHHSLITKTQSIRKQSTHIDNKAPDHAHARQPAKHSQQHVHGMEPQTHAHSALARDSAQPERGGAARGDGRGRERHVRTRDQPPPARVFCACCTRKTRGG